MLWLKPLVTSTWKAYDAPLVNTAAPALLSTSCGPRVDAATEARLSAGPDT